MAMNTEVLAIVLGGGQGSRLFPLTFHRSKPAVPIGGSYRLIDIPISNCINSNIRHIYILTQFNSTSLHRHIHQSYAFDRFSRGFVEILAAQQTSGGSSWYQGTADAVRQNLRYFLEQMMAPVFKPDAVDLTQRFFVNHVRGRGPLAAFRIGNTPYGVLPVSSLARWQTASGADQEQGRHRGSAYGATVRWAPATGRRTSKVEPAASSLVTVTSPPWFSATCFTIARPSPVPPVSRERARSTR